MEKWSSRNRKIELTFFKRISDKIGIFSIGSRKFLRIIVYTVGDGILPGLNPNLLLDDDPYQEVGKMEDLMKEIAEKENVLKYLRERYEEALKDNEIFLKKIEECRKYEPKL